LRSSSGSRGSSRATTASTKKSFQRVDEKVDMMIAVDGDNTFPPNYVKSYDEGRPRK
jgi:hypothetical protein